MITVERRFVPILAAAGAVMLLHQVADLAAAIGGADPATPTGRLGLVAVIWTRGPALLAADLILVGAALRAPWTRLLAGLAVAHVLLGIGAVATAPFFLRDAGHMAGSISVAELTSFRITVLRILAALIILGAGAVIVGLSLVGAGRAGTRAA